MRKIKLFLIFALLASFNTLTAQEFKLEQMYFYVFDQDSLKGFDENAAAAAAISEHYFGSEFKVKMYQQKRSFINDRYNLWYKFPTDNHLPSNASSKINVVPACTNEDFEAAGAVDGNTVVTASNQINGWTITRGLHNLVPGANSCNLNACCPSQPVESVIYSASSGLIDPVIGAVYPIFSVFGSSPPNMNAASNNTHITQAMGGSSFIKINSNLNNYSVEKLSKTFSVTQSNALFQFAFISVFSTGHSCCSAGAFQIKLTNATTNTLIPCPTFSASALSISCSNTNTGIDFLNTQTGTPATTNSSYIFNKWKLSSMDLSQYIGQNITIEIITSDCDAGGHYGYVYFDAQCGPMVIYGNGTPYGAGSGNVTVPTCGAAGATLCAASGLGPYSWSGPGVNPPFNSPSMSNQCYTTNISGTYTLFMNPQGSCSPITRIISSTITPAPLLAASVVQAVCGSTTAIVTVTPSGSAAVPSTLIWSPNPLTINPTTTQATYSIPPGPAPTIVNITATDPLGCLIVATASVNPAAPYPTFTINNVTGSSSITCINFSVVLDAITTYTYGFLNYNWVSSSASFSSTPVTITTPGNYTCTVVDPQSGCSAVHTINIGGNTTPPTSTITPLLQNITCSNSAIQTITATCNPTLNIQHQFMAPQGGTVFINSPVAIFSPGPGTYTHVLLNLLNGCKSTKTFSINTSVGFPSFNILSPQEFTLGCGTHSIISINVPNAQTTPIPGGTLSYTLLPPGAGPGYGFSSSSTWTNITVPGTWTVIVKDALSNCQTKVPISVIQNTFGPQIDAIVPNQTLTCFSPTVLLEGISETPNVTYNWSFPTPPGNLQGSPIPVVATANTSNTFVAMYTLTIVDLNNTCKSNTLIPIYQNMFPPKVGLALSRADITCSTPSVVLTNTSSSNSPLNFPHTEIIQGYFWQGPPPQEDGPTNSTYIAKIPGVYTLTAKDLNNGCVASGTVFIADNRIFPVLNNPNAPAPFVLDCGQTSVSVSPIYSNPLSNFQYLWNLNAAGTSSTGVLTNSILIVNSVGEFEVEVTNPINGCRSYAEVEVINGVLTPSITPDKITGFAPLTVKFDNSSRSNGSSTIAIQSVWNFGNGTTYTNNSNFSPSTIYNQPGTYTVTVFINKGSFCQEVTSKIITVEIPSKIEVPNVFTPNGDGSNDLFFVQAANLSEITALIFDRWGNKVYELVSKTGNISWDGKNQYGKELAEGTYFYIIKATGKDGVSYDTKGNVSLFR